MYDDGVNSRIDYPIYELWWQSCRLLFNKVYSYNYMNKYIIMYLFFDILLTIEGATLLHLTTNHLMRNPKQHSVCMCAYVL